MRGRLLMPQYQYRAVGHSGGVSSGVIAAADESGALQTLRWIAWVVVAAFPDRRKPSRKMT